MDANLQQVIQLLVDSDVRNKDYIIHLCENVLSLQKQINSQRDEIQILHEELNVLRTKYLAPPDVPAATPYNYKEWEGSGFPINWQDSKYPTPNIHD